MDSKDNVFSITVDVWEDSYLRSSFISCVVQYINEGVLIHRLLAMKCMEEQECTGNFGLLWMHNIKLSAVCFNGFVYFSNKAQNIIEKMDDTLKEFGCNIAQERP